MSGLCLNNCGRDTNHPLGICSPCRLDAKIEYEDMISKLGSDTLKTRDMEDPMPARKKICGCGNEYEAKSNNSPRCPECAKKRKAGNDLRLQQEGRKAKKAEPAAIEQHDAGLGSSSGVGNQHLPIPEMIAQFFATLGPVLDNRLRGMIDKINEGCVAEAITDIKDLAKELG